MNGAFTSIILPGDTKIRELTPEGIAEHLNTAPVPGIWLFQRVGRGVQPLRPADQTERTTLFDALELPQVTVLPVQKTSAWMCMPANLNAYEKSVKARVPLPLSFAPDTVSMFDPVLARVYKQRRVYLLYEDVNERFPVQQVEKMRELMAAFMKGAPRPLEWFSRTKGLPFELTMALDFALQTAERPIESMSKYALKLAGATFKSMEDLGSGQYRVNYTYKGYADSVIINDTLAVLNSGICLSGRDQEQDLSSIVLIKDKKRDYDGDYDENDD